MNHIVTDNSQVTGGYVSIDGELFYQIANSHLMPEFFMSLVGSSDHWMFVSSDGALTAGRCDPDSALFPYVSDDQISVARSVTGPVTILRIEGEKIWEPFAAQRYDFDSCVRNVYKNPLGTRLVFEEINESLELSFRYQWAFSEKFGFVRQCHLQNNGALPRSIELLDGLQNVLPYGVASEFILRFSNLANAYKKSELISDSGLGIFYLSSIPTDRAEPNEGLKATTIWQSGLNPNATLISTEQLNAFRQNRDISEERVVRGKAGAYLLNQSIELGPGESLDWMIVAELEQDHSDIVGLDRWIRESATLFDEVNSDIKECEQDFLGILSSADGVQHGSNERRANRHLSNTVFNVMRGGIPVDDYKINSDDFRQHIESFNKQAFAENREVLDSLADQIDLAQMIEKIETANDPDLKRLAFEYLPLAFSRRHGDPTRPWNRFAIKLRAEDGRTNLNYQGNWRDIFQNWEALAFSFPKFTNAMICRFVNATTADGYNPYRVTKNGFEWEAPEPDDLWANIGYWGDHQIIYLLKLLEWNRRTDPSGLDSLLDSQTFVHANVPYRIKDFAAIKNDPQDTIEFDHQLSETIEKRVEKWGADGKLLRNQSDEIHRVSLLEKLLTLSLAKLSNFVPDGGIWLNTQRPEWNDANNALVGNGLSMVTACYLHRWFDFLQVWLSENQTSTSFSISEEVLKFFKSISAILNQHRPGLSSLLSGKSRCEIVEALSQAGSDYRSHLYDHGVSGECGELSPQDLLAFVETAKEHLQATIKNNRRSDGLYHAYNLIDIRDGSIEIEQLYEMLEGQVAVLSAGLLTANETNELLNVLRESSLYRADQDSYILYPNRTLTPFLEKNRVSEEQVAKSPLLTRLLKEGNEHIVKRDVEGCVHFNGSFRNANDLKQALADLPDTFKADAVSGSADLIKLFEDLFGHRQFTGRSGTFFGYEGLGSIYWHMVSKLALAVSENFFWAIDNGETQETLDSLREHFQAIRAGIGAEKSPQDYGAFPSDPYSHTPENAGVKQPGMTGQVKEDLLSRFAEIGVHIENGCIQFRIEMFDQSELVADESVFAFFDLNQQIKSISIPQNGFAFTICQVPVIYHAADANQVTIHFDSGETKVFDSLQLDRETSESIFSRTGEIEKIECAIRFTTSS